MIADRMRLKAQKTVDILGGPAIIVLGDGNGVKCELSLPKHLKDELVNVKSGDVIFLTIERLINEPSGKEE